MTVAQGICTLLPYPGNLWGELEVIVKYCTGIIHLFF